MTLVVDASALVFATTENTGAAGDLRRRLVGNACHAPHLIDAEFGNVLRRKVLRGELDRGLAVTVLDLAPNLIDQRYEQVGHLAQAAWSLRENLTFYDALYVALAGALGAALVTTDARLAAAPGLPCRIMVAG